MPCRQATCCPMATCLPVTCIPDCMVSLTDHNTLSNSFNTSTFIATKTIKCTEVTTKNTGNIHTARDQEMVVLLPVYLGQFGGVSAELAINAINSGRSAMVKAHALTASSSGYHANTSEKGRSEVKPHEKISPSKPQLLQPMDKSRRQDNHRKSGHQLDRDMRMGHQLPPRLMRAASSVALKHRDL